VCLAQYADILNPTAAKENFLPPCDSLELEQETRFTVNSAAEMEKKNISPATGLTYTNRSVIIALIFRMEKFMKIEQVEAYSGLVKFLQLLSINIKIYLVVVKHGRMNYKDNESFMSAFL
jgi:hypothetical protein